MPGLSSDTSIKSNIDLIHISYDYDKYIVYFHISIWIIIAFLSILIITLIITNSINRYKLVKLNISLGKVGIVEFSPNSHDIQIAHKIWTELITRKAALPLDLEYDVITEIYDSWYDLFTKVRNLISEIPADLLRNNKSTQEIIKISTDTLNNGIRPHLTKWQARFRNWYHSNSDKLREFTPQELQRMYPEYDELSSEIIKINEDMILYARDLKKIIYG